MACSHSLHVHEMMGKALRRAEVAERLRPALREAWERMLPWRLKAEIGALAPYEAAPAISAIEAGCEALRVAQGGLGTGVAPEWCRRVVRPALASAPVDADDAAWLGNLSPSR